MDWRLCGGAVLVVGLTDLIHGWSVWRDLLLVCLAGFAVGLSVWICGWSVWMDLQFLWLSVFGV